MPIRKKIFLITALFYILYLVFPLFADTFNIPVWLPSMAAVAVMVVLYPQAFANKTFYWFLSYAVVLGLYVIIGKSLTIGIGTVADKKKIIIEFAFVLPTLSMVCILMYLDDLKLMYKLVLWFLIVLFVSFIIAYPLMTRYNSLREAYFSEGREFSVPGLPSYSLMHSYVFVIPLLCYMYSVVRVRYKWLVVLAIIASGLVIIKTDVGACILIGALVIFISLVYRESRSVGYYLVFIVFALILFILYQGGVFVDLIDKVLPYFDGTSFEGKLIDLKMSMIGSQLSGSFDKRQDLHNISWNSFFMNPFVGTSKVGGHSALIDRLGGMGLLAFIPYMMIFVSFIKQIKHRFQTQKAREFFYLGVIAGFILMYQKGLWGAECWLMYMVLMPFGIIVFEKDLKTEYINYLNA